MQHQDKLPVIFFGHGSPMNAIEDNEFSRKWRETGNAIPKPRAILCISAHWETKGTQVTSMAQPDTIHDFGGFPKELFMVQYPAPGSPGLAKEIISLVRKTEVVPDTAWGLDHGCWSVLKHLYPDADIPVVQLSLDYSRDAQYHYSLAQELAPLRRQGVLIIGSGNMVHNLGMVAWDKLDAEYAYDWAGEANEEMKKLILEGDFGPLINYPLHGKAFGLAIPTPEHFLPLLYVLALKEENEKVTLFNDKVVAGSLSMLSVITGE